MTDQRTDRAARAEDLAQLIWNAGPEGLETSEGVEVHGFLRDYAAALRAEPEQRDIGMVRAQIGMWVPVTGQPMVLAAFDRIVGDLRADPVRESEAERIAAIGRVLESRGLQRSDSVLADVLHWLEGPVIIGQAETERGPCICDGGAGSLRCPIHGTETSNESARTIPADDRGERAPSHDPRRPGSVRGGSREGAGPVPQTFVTNAVRAEQDYLSEMQDLRGEATGAPHPVETGAADRKAESTGQGRVAQAAMERVQKAYSAKFFRNADRPVDPTALGDFAESEDEKRVAGQADNVSKPSQGERGDTLPNPSPLQPRAESGTSGPATKPCQQDVAGGERGESGSLDAQAVIRRLCKLQSRVAEHVGHEYAADCFCGKSGFWNVRDYGGTRAEGYRNDGVALGFIEQAVDEALTAQKKASESTVDAGDLTSWVRDFAASQKTLPPDLARIMDENREELYVTDEPVADAVRQVDQAIEDAIHLNRPAMQVERLRQVRDRLTGEPTADAGGDEDVRRLVIEAICARGLASRCEGRSEAGDEAYTDDILAEKWAEHEVAEMRAFAALDRLIADYDGACEAVRHLEFRVREEMAETTRLRTLVERQKVMIEDLDRQHIDTSRDRIEYDESGELDEFVATGMCHLERMSHGSWHLMVTRGDEIVVGMFLTRRKKAVGANVIETTLDRQHIERLSPTEIRTRLFEAAMYTKQWPEQSKHDWLEGVFDRAFRKRA